MFRYTPNDLELWISSIYQNHGILHPHELDIDYIADIFGIEIGVTLGPARVYWDDEYTLILLTSHLLEKEKRAQFFHELCHPLRHVGNQHEMPRLFRELQEMQADTFALYASMPFYMLKEFTNIRTKQALVRELARAFNLPTPFVKKRVDQIVRRIESNYWFASWEVAL